TPSPTWPTSTTPPNARPAFIRCTSTARRCGKTRRSPASLPAASCHEAPAERRPAGFTIGACMAAALRAPPPSQNKIKFSMAPAATPAPPGIVGKKEMGARLRAERKARKMTLQDLSHASGIAVSTISKAELGQIARSYEKFAALARGLGIDMTRLLMLGDSPQAEVAAKIGSASG